MPEPFIFLGATSERERATRIAAARMTVGTTLLVPSVGRRLFGVTDRHDNQALRLVSRLFGIRNIVLGVWTLQVRDADADARRLCYTLNAAVDAADVAVLLGTFVRHRDLRRAGLMGAALGSSALLGWIRLLQDV